MEATAIPSNSSLTGAHAAGVNVSVANMTGAHKAALLLITLGEKVSAEIVKHLADEEVQLLTREIAQVKSVPSLQIEEVLTEFHQMMIAHEYMVTGGIDYARKMLMGAFPPELARRLLDRVMKTLGADVVTFDQLEGADPQQLAKFVVSEHPQTIALILSHLNPTQAAALLISLPDEMRSDVALRMASLEVISPDVVSKIAAVIGQKLKSVAQVNRESYGGVRAVAEMFNRLDSDSSKAVLEYIEQKNGTLVETIRHLMFMFEDIVMVDTNGIKELINRADRKVLTLALKGTSDQLKGHFLQCLSQRGGEMLKDDMEAMGSVKVKDVEAAQQQIISVVRQLESEGIVSLKGTVGDQYVD